nr:uncharacterized protein LOC107281199 isoform X4 [Oryza sativa Japonica Group]
MEVTTIAISLLVKPPERDHANDALEHALERRRFDIVVVRPFSSIPKQAAVPRISPRPPLQDASRTPAGNIKITENTSFLPSADLGSPPPSSLITAASVSHCSIPSAYTISLTSQPSCMPSFSSSSSRRAVAVQPRRSAAVESFQPKPLLSKLRRFLPTAWFRLSL